VGKITAWRITSEKYADTAFSGEGAKEYSGRFNSVGIPVVYTSASISLATLEPLAKARERQRLSGRVALPVALTRARLSLATWGSSGGLKRPPLRVRKPTGRRQVDPIREVAGSQGSERGCARGAQLPDQSGAPGFRGGLESRGPLVRIPGCQPTDLSTEAHQKTRCTFRRVPADLRRSEGPREEYLRRVLTGCVRGGFSS
jgi:hypothetical protein